VFFDNTVVLGRPFRGTDEIKVRLYVNDILESTCSIAQGSQTCTMIPNASIMKSDTIKVTGIVIHTGLAGSTHEDTRTAIQRGYVELTP